MINEHVLMMVPPFLFMGKAGIEKKKKKKRGQPKKPPTKVIRVPISKLPEIEKILKRVD